MPDQTSIYSDFITYPDKGLTWISDLASVHPRDVAGNIILQESGSDNPLLIIEPVKFDFTVESIKKVIETRFNFFQFPVTTVVGTGIKELNTDIGAFEFELDPITKKFEVPPFIDDAGQLGTYQRIGTSYTSNWFYNGGQDQKGYTRIPFSTDNGQGSIEITAAMLDYVKSKNQVIKFTVFFQVVSSFKDEYNKDPKGWNTSFRMMLSRTEAYDNWEPWNGSTSQPVIYTEDSGRLGNDPGTNKPWTVPGKTDVNGNPIPMAGLFGSNDYPGLYLEYIIDPTTEKPGRKYFIQASAGTPSWILSDSARWDVTAIDRPNYQTLYGNVLNIGPNSQLETGNNITIATRADSVDIKYTNGTLYNKLGINKFDTNTPSVTKKDTTTEGAGITQQEIDNANAAAIAAAEARLREIDRLQQIYLEETVRGLEESRTATITQKLQFKVEHDKREAELVSKMTPAQLDDFRKRLRQVIRDWMETNINK